AGVARRVVATGQARPARTADEEQPGGLPKIETRVVDQAQRACDEFARHQPPPAAARRRRRQRDEPARHRRKRLVGREDNRFPFVGNGDRAERIFADGELKGRREIVERDELLIRDHRERQRAASAPRQERQRRRRRLARERGGEGEDKRDGDGREMRNRAKAQWRISELRGPPLYAGRAEARSAESGLTR